MYILNSEDFICFPVLLLLGYNIVKSIAKAQHLYLAHPMCPLHSSKRPLEPQSYLSDIISIIPLVNGQWSGEDPEITMSYYKQHLGDKSHSLEGKKPILTIGNCSQ